MSEENTRELPDNTSFEHRVFARFDAIEKRFDGVFARFESMERRFDWMDTRFDGMDARFDVVDSRFNAMDARFDGLDARVQVLESKALDTKPIWERALAEILAVKQGVQDLNRKIDVLNRDVLQVRADQQGVEKRMDVIESSLQ